MRWDGPWVARIVFALLFALAAAWLVRRTEWVEVREPLPLSPALADDGTWAARHLLEGLGLRTRRVDELDPLPPAGATLVLTARYWGLIDGSAQRLRAWVEAGGHLVVDNGVTPAGEPEWLPLAWADPPRRHAPFTAGCRVLHQRAGLAPAFGDERGFVACNSAWRHLVALPQAPPLRWALDSDERGAEVLRVDLGRGRVTAVASALDFEFQGERAGPPGADAGLANFANRGLLRGDHGALLAAIVDARPGAEVWFVTRIERPPLPLWLWQRAAPALLLAAAALGFALWRGFVRFGPLATDAPPARRSIAAQVRGSADFLFRHQPAALHAMALRALDETAQRRLAGWRRLAPAERTAALARASALPAARLADALAARPGRTPAAWSDDIALVESARRALHERPPAPSPAPEIRERTR